MQIYWATLPKISTVFIHSIIYQYLPILIVFSVVKVAEPFEFKQRPELLVSILL
jgi:hypothetical protein